MPFLRLPLQMPPPLATPFLATSGAQILNVSLVGHNLCAGLFTGGAGVDVGNTTSFPNQGVILSSGKVSDIMGPNDENPMFTVLFSPGDTSLSSLVGRNTNDACSLQIHFKARKELKGPI